MTTKYTTGGGRASIKRAVDLVRGEIAGGYDFVLGVGVVPRAFGSCAVSKVYEVASNFIPRLIDEIIGPEVPVVVTEIAPDTTVQASEVVAGAIARQVTGRSPIA